MDISDIDPAGDALILDVREDDEWAAGHIDGATHLPMNSVPSQAATLPTDRQINVICKMGGRSAQVTAWLRNQGYDAYNVDGGMLAWAVAHRPMVTDEDAEPYVA
ncbi:MAG: glpE [Pseudonocardiales bacterium]|nr:glpE [Pseudonocardiales bacterium]